MAGITSKYECMDWSFANSCAAMSSKMKNNTENKRGEQMVVPIITLTYTKPEIVLLTISVIINLRVVTSTSF